MNMKGKIVLGSLLGTVLIEAVFIACNSPPDQLTDAMASLDGSTLDAMILDAMQIHDANAQDGGGLGCPSCVVRTTTADTDATRLVRGTTGGSASSTVLVDGPFVLTDVQVANSSGAVELWTVATGSPCGLEPGLFAPNDVVYLNSNGPNGSYPAIHGARYFVPAGQSICYHNISLAMNWAGFRPYE